MNSEDSQAKMLEIRVKEIRGKCPVYKVGDKIVIDDPKILLDRTDALCTHAPYNTFYCTGQALSTMLHYVTILEHDWCPVKLGLTTPDDPICSALIPESLTLKVEQ